MISTPNGDFRCYMNLMAFDSLPANSTGPHSGSFPERISALEAAGFDGVQFAKQATAEELSECRARSFGVASGGRVNSPRESAILAEQLAADGYECATLHVGWGLEDDSTAGHLIESVLKASQRWRIPLYVETHRATIFQDMWRAAGLVQRFPELRINGDFSHWYTGQEMVYGGFEMKFAFLAPVLERVRFLHGRIGSPGCMQVRIDPDPAGWPLYVEHFRRLWTACFRNFRLAAQPGDCIYFAPELLAPDIYYARTFPDSNGNPVEESDRWEQSLLLKQIAEDCFREAVA